MKKGMLLLLPVVLFFSCKKTDPVLPLNLSGANSIVAFSFGNLLPVVNASIDSVTKEINATVPPGTDVTELVPTIALSAGATCLPASGIAQNFTNPVLYKVTAANGQLQNYTVKITTANKYLNLIKVVNSFAAYDANSWERQHTVYETKDMQIYMVCIWNTSAPKISLYKFDPSFNPTAPQYTYGGTAWVAYRESFNILNVNIAISNSAAYAMAFKQILNKITAEKPAQHYGIKYSGHGVSSGGLFENKISMDDARDLLLYFNGLIKAKIDFLDWNTNCNGASYNNFLNQYKYTKYYLASDILRGGYNFDIDEYLTYQHEQKMVQFFSSAKSIKSSLIEMINSERLFWASPKTRNFMTTGNVTQSISIFDTQKFDALATATNMAVTTYKGDALKYIQQNYPGQEAAFKEFRFHYVCNKDFFSWPDDSNGFYLK